MIFTRYICHLNTFDLPKLSECELKGFSRGHKQKMTNKKCFAFNNIYKTKLCIYIYEPKSAQQECSTSFVRFEHSVCCGSLMTTYIALLALLVEHSLVHWYQQCATVHHVPKCMSCHKVIVGITGGHIVFMIACIYIMPVFLFVRIEYSVCRE